MVEPNLGVNYVNSGEALQWLLHPSSTNSEQKLRWEWLSLLTLLAQPPCTATTTWAALPGILSPSPAKAPDYSGSAWWLVHFTAFLHFPLFKGQINPGPELTKKVIPVEMRSSVKMLLCFGSIWSYLLGSSVLLQCIQQWPGATWITLTSHHHWFCPPVSSFSLAQVIGPRSMRSQVQCGMSGKLPPHSDLALIGMFSGFFNLISKISKPSCFAKLSCSALLLCLPA